jgi:hypothetical protein
MYDNLFCYMKINEEDQGRDRIRIHCTQQRDSDPVGLLRFKFWGL